MAESRRHQLTGGGALLRDLDRLISEETGLHAGRDDPLTWWRRRGGRAGTGGHARQRVLRAGVTQVPSAGSAIHAVAASRNRVAGNVVFANTLRRRRYVCAGRVPAKPPFQTVHRSIRRPSTCRLIADLPQPAPAMRRRAGGCWCTWCWRWCRWCLTIGGWLRAVRVQTEGRGAAAVVAGGFAVGAGSVPARGWVVTRTQPMRDNKLPRNVAGVRRAQCAGCRRRRPRTRLRGLLASAERGRLTCSWRRSSTSTRSHPPAPGAGRRQRRRRGASAGGDRCRRPDGP